MFLTSFAKNSPKYSPENTTYVTVKKRIDKALLMVQGIYNSISGYICSYKAFYLLKNICVLLPVELVANL